MSVFVVSDVHGYYDLFVEGLSRIGFSDEDYLWCLGDAIDRGPDGIRILQHIMAADNMDLIIGNHELMMLNSVAISGDPKCNGLDASLWMDANGGRATFRQYKSLMHEERVQLLEWLQQRYVVRQIDIEGIPYCLSHSFFSPDSENKRYSELTYNEVWNITWSSIWREDYFTHAMDIYPKYEYRFIIGHVPVQSIRRYEDPVGEWNVLKSLHHKNVINVDGGCSYGRSDDVNNGLIILRLENESELAIAMSNAEESE